MITHSSIKKITYLALDYEEYMNFRAQQEGMKHELDVEFYLEGLMAGIQFFFGIYHDGEFLTEDIQNPDAFEKWLENKT